MNLAFSWSFTSCSNIARRVAILSSIWASSRSVSFNFLSSSAVKFSNVTTDSSFSLSSCWILNFKCSISPPFCSPTASCPFIAELKNSFSRIILPNSRRNSSKSFSFLNDSIRNLLFCSTISCQASFISRLSRPSSSSFSTFSEVFSCWRRALNLCSR